MNLETNITSMSDDLFNSLMSEQPTDTPQVQETNTQPDSTSTVDKTVVEQSNTDPNIINQLDEDTFNQLMNGVDSTENGEITSKESVNETVTTEAVTNTSVDVLKNITDFFVEKGYWEDFQGRDEFDFTDNEKFGQLLTEQYNKKAADLYTERVEKTGEYGKAILSYIEEGGDPDELLDIFKQQDTVRNYEPQSDDEKKAFVQQYYTAILGDTRAAKITTDLEMDGELDTEVNSIKAKYDEQFKAQRVALQKEQQEQNKIRQQQEESFRNNIVEEVSKRKDLTEKQRRELLNSVLVQDQQLPTGQLVNKFYVEFANLQNNLSEYLDAVQFITDKQGYLARYKAEEANREADKSFNFIKRNASISKSTGSAPAPTRKDEPVTTFKFI